MEPNGVRLACPDCSWSCVMRSEQDVPDGVRKVVEGVPWCPNCNQPMRPIASVDTTDRPRSGISAAMTLEQIAAKCVELNHEATDLANELKDAAEEHKAAKKAYDAKLVTLSLAVERLGRVMGGEQIQADLPLLTIAEEDEDEHRIAEAFASVSESAVLDQAAGSEAIRLAAEEIRHQLATHSIVVTVEDIEAWTLAQYDVVIAYLSGVEAVPDGGLPIPDFLPAPLGDEPEPARAVPLRRARKPGPVVTV